MKYLAGIILTMSVVLYGCESCNGPFPPYPGPTPILAFGKVIKTLPATHPGIGSIDIVGDNFWEYCQGYSELRKRDMDGDLQEIVNLDGRLYGLWAVCWDSQRKCFWGTNPNFTGFELEQANLIEINRAGDIIETVRVSNNWSKPALIIRDLDYNADYEYTDADGNKITIGLISTSDWHYSLRKSDWIDPDNGFWEQYWFRLNIQVAGITNVGELYYAACDGNNPEEGKYPIIEFRQPPRKQWAERTGRKITVPGVWFSSLKTAGRSLWGKGIAKNSGETKIYQISLGE